MKRSLILQNVEHIHHFF